MDGSFACPECGSSVEVQGLAPGRQVVCGFCQQLVEVPYLPRVPVAAWRRRRFGRSRWVAWTTAVLAGVLTVLFLIGGLQYAREHFRAKAKGSIQKLIDSSFEHENSGRFSQALIDLDVALTLVRNGNPTDLASIQEQQKRRGVLARRDANSILDELIHRVGAPFPLGEWLNLIARTEQDPDLAILHPSLVEQFQKQVRREVDAELLVARQAFQATRMSESLNACDRIAKLQTYLVPDVQIIIRRETEKLVQRLLASHGVVVESPKGTFVYGSQESYLTSMLPVLLQTLEKKGYLPYRPTSPWATLWTNALYKLKFSVAEHLEENYLSSENRLTRIEARLTLTSKNILIWQTIPTARTEVPLPGLPAYLASRLASSRVRSDEIERMLYQNTRIHIEERFVYALNRMPACP